MRLGKVQVGDIFAVSSHILNGIYQAGSPLAEFSDTDLGVSFHRHLGVLVDVT